MSSGRTYTSQEIVSAVRDAANSGFKTAREYEEWSEDQIGAPSRDYIQRHMGDGDFSGWSIAKWYAGGEIEVMPSREILKAELRRVYWEDEPGITRSKLNEKSFFSDNTFRRHLGGEDSLATMEDLRTHVPDLLEE